MAEYLIQDSSLVAIGDAIREKTGKTIPGDIQYNRIRIRNERYRQEAVK